jgi:hypothetical protein
VSLVKPQTVRPGAREAHDRLTRALVTLASRGLRTHRSDVELHHLWTSDRPEERAVAVRLCRGCPVIRQCRAAAEAQGERFVVWGGKDFSPRPYEIKINSDQDH